MNKTPDTSAMLRLRRKALGLSQRKAADMLGVSQSLLAQAETGNWPGRPHRLAEWTAAYDLREAIEAARLASFEKPTAEEGHPSVRRPHTRTPIR